MAAVADKSVASAAAAAAAEGGRRPGAAAASVGAAATTAEFRSLHPTHAWVTTAVYDERRPSGSAPQRTWRTEAAGEVAGPPALDVRVGRALET